MTDLLAARSQMAISLGFHILFAVVGMGMPALMVASEALWLRTRDPVWLELTHRWAKGTAILFAVGAVSGTVLSFELGLLWPTFMERAGPIIGMPFSLEGFAFFLEAIFLGIYLYGWDKVDPRLHWLAGLAVLVSGTASGIFVVCANAFMNTPAGFRLEGGVAVDIDPWAALWNPAAPTQVTHMTLAAFQAVGFAVAGIHAWALLKDRRSPFHRRALAVALMVGGTAALLEPVSGDFLAKQVARNQPVKLAAMEGHWETEAGAPLRIGGLPDEATETTPYSIEIPYALSILSFGDPNAVVRGLKDFPVEDRPPVAVTHLAFQVMVAAGTWMITLTALVAFLAWRRRGLPDDPWLLRLVVLTGPAGLVAVEAGWVVTEVGRQPWIIQGWLRTADAVTPMPGLVVPLVTFSLLYLVLGVVVIGLLRRQVFASPGFAAGGPTGEVDHA